MLVTGAAGFVGACAVRALLGRGHDVHAVVRPGSAPWRLPGLGGRLVQHGVDLGDGDAVKALLLAVRPAAVVHLATHGAYERQSDSRAMLQTNILGTLHLLEASLKVGVGLFVRAGSSSEYGFKTEPMRETDRLEPNSVYAVGEGRPDAPLRAGRRASGSGSRGLPAVLRLRTVGGADAADPDADPAGPRRLAAGDGGARGRARFRLRRRRPGSPPRFRRLAELRGDVINLGTGVETTLREVVAAVLELTGSRSEVRWGAMPARRWDTDRWVADPRRRPAPARLAADVTTCAAVYARWRPG